MPQTQKMYTKYDCENKTQIKETTNTKKEMMMQQGKQKPKYKTNT